MAYIEKKWWEVNRFEVLRCFSFSAIVPSVLVQLYHSSKMLNFLYSHFQYRNFWRITLANIIKMMVGSLITQTVKQAQTFNMYYTCEQHRQRFIVHLIKHVLVRLWNIQKTAEYWNTYCHYTDMWLLMAARWFVCPLSTSAKKWLRALSFRVWSFKSLAECSAFAK